MKIHTKKEVDTPTHLYPADTDVEVPDELGKELVKAGDATEVRAHEHSVSKQAENREKR